MAIYGVMVAAWSSNNKWSILGGMRSSAQMVSYEIAMSLAVVGCVLAGQLSASKVEYGLLPLGALGLTLTTFLFAAIPQGLSGTIDLHTIRPLDETAILQAAACSRATFLPRPPRRAIPSPCSRARSGGVRDGPRADRTDGA